MDFGAVVCKPVPVCDQCPFRSNCFAYKHDLVSTLPIKEKRVRIRTRWFYYLVMVNDAKLAIQQRSGKDIWQGLYEFPLVETNGEGKPAAVLRKACKMLKMQPGDIELVHMSEPSRQQLSHQLILARFLLIRIKTMPTGPAAWSWVKRPSLTNYAFPRIINSYLQRSFRPGVKD